MAEVAVSPGGIRERQSVLDLIAADWPAGAARGDVPVPPFPGFSADSPARGFSRGSGDANGLDGRLGGTHMSGFPGFLERSVSLVGAFDLKIIFVLFLLFAVVESTSLSIPYLLETMWLLAGYELLHDELTVPKLALLLLTAQLGRQAGALGLYYGVRRGESFFFRHARGLVAYANRVKAKFTPKVRKPSPALVPRSRLLTPWSAAAGILLWMKIPVLVFLATKRELKILLSGALLAGIIYDGTFVGIGAVLGKTTDLKPWQMIPYFLVVLAVIGVATTVARRVVTVQAARRKRKALEQSAA